MENTNTDQSIFEMGFDEQVRQELKGAATWGGFAAIVSLSGSILSMVAYFIVKPKVGKYGINSNQEAEITQFANTSGFVSAVFTLIIGVILFYLLNKFSRSAKNGLANNDNYFINEGLGSLSSYFKFIGVLLIIVLVLAGLAFLVGLGKTV
jgi:magnesium-transporting ATPase (P-type)